MVTFFSFSFASSTQGTGSWQVVRLFLLDALIILSACDVCTFSATLALGVACSVLLTPGKLQTREGWFAFTWEEHFDSCLGPLFSPGRLYPFLPESPHASISFPFL